MTAPRSGRARLPRRRGLRLVQFPPPLLLLLLLAAAGPARGWESGDLELFDLVEEVQLNFYQFLGVQQVSPAAGPPEGGAAGQKRGNVRLPTRRRGRGGLGPGSCGAAGTAAQTWPSWAPAALASPVLAAVSSSPQPQKESSAFPARVLSALLPFSVPGWTVPPAWGGDALSFLRRSGGRAFHPAVLEEGGGVVCGKRSCLQIFTFSVTPKPYGYFSCLFPLPFREDRNALWLASVLQKFFSRCTLKSI